MIDIQLFRTIGQVQTGLAKEDREMASYYQSHHSWGRSLTDMMKGWPILTMDTGLSTIRKQ